MNRTPRLRPRPILAFAAVIGALIGGAVGMLVPLATHYQAAAQVAMVPGTNLTTADASAYWEVLTQGQVSHTAATVFSDPRWKASAVSAAGVDASQITLTAGAIPNTTMVSITVGTVEPWTTSIPPTDVVRDLFVALVNQFGAGDEYRDSTR